jgi:hypothetical protein
MVDSMAWCETVLALLALLAVLMVLLAESGVGVMVAEESSALMVGFLIVLGLLAGAGRDCRGCSSPG